MEEGLNVLEQKTEFYLNFTGFSRIFVNFREFSSISLVFCMGEGVNVLEQKLGFIRIEQDFAEFSWIFSNVRELC